MSKVAIKICGLSTQATVQAAVNAGADFIGFVCYQKSLRHVAVSRAAELKKLMPESVKSVIVLVNPNDELLAEIATQMQPDFFQLHGDETVERLQEIRNKYPQIGIIKAIPVQTADDINFAEEFAKAADYLLFDKKPTDKNMVRGGSGIPFDWELLANKKFAKEWFLSGGLNAKNVADAIKKTGAKFVDVSSGVESSAGVKDVKMIEEFVKAVRA